MEIIYDHCHYRVSRGTVCVQLNILTTLSKEVVVKTNIKRELVYLQANEGQDNLNISAGGFSHTPYKSNQNVPMSSVDIASDPEYTPLDFCLSCLYPDLCMVMAH